MDELTRLNKQIEVLEERNQALMKQLQLAKCFNWKRSSIIYQV